MLASTTAGVTVKITDEVWIATALLHREHPNRLLHKEVARRTLTAGQKSKKEIPVRLNRKRA